MCSYTIHSAISEAWKKGYAYGYLMNLNNEVVEPEHMSAQALDEWNKGVNAAICDRLS